MLGGGRNSWRWAPGMKRPPFLFRETRGERWSMAFAKVSAGSAAAKTGGAHDPGLPPKSLTKTNSVRKDASIFQVAEARLYAPCFEA